MPLTYCFFSAQFLPVIGGVENYTNYLAEKIVSHGDNAIVVTSARKGLPEHEILENGIEVIRLPSLPLGNGRLPIVFYNKKTCNILKELVKRPINRIIVQTRLYFLSALGARFAKKHKIPAIVIEHGSAYTKTGFALPDFLLKIYTEWLLKDVYRHCKRFYGVSKNACNWLSARGIATEGVLYNSVSLERIRQASKNQEKDFRQEYQIPKSSPVLVFTGRLIQSKGILELIQAVEKYNLKNTIPLYLLAAGEGELLEMVNKNPSPQILSLGALPFSQVVALLAQADLFCLPTAMEEGLPTSILEAAACGVFVIATAKGGITEILPDNNYGILLKDNLPNTINDGLQYALANTDIRKNAAAKLQTRIETLFSFDSLYENLSNISWEGNL